MPVRPWVSRPAMVRELSLTEALDLGPHVWDDLLARTSADSPFMSWAWHRAWANASRERDVRAGRALVLEAPDGALRALLPVALRRQRFRRVPLTALTWAIDDMGCPDHLDMPALPDIDLGPLADAVLRLPWHVVVLANVREDALGVDALSAALARRGCTVQRTPLWPCPYIELPNDWEQYLQALSRSRRQMLRRQERRLRTEHGMTVTEFGAEDFESGWKWLLELHLRRWGDAGNFAKPRMERLNRHFAAALAEAGRLWLFTLNLDRAPAAAWCGFSFGDTVYFYQGGRDPRWDRESVGIVIVALMIRRAIERGFRRFDFLRGQESYKAYWTHTYRTCHEVVLFRPGWRGWPRVLDWLRTLSSGARGGHA